MKEAFERAGVKPAADRLIEIAIAARKEHPRDFSRSRDMVYAAVSSDAALLWELFKPYRMQAVQNLISSVRLESNRMEGREGAMVVVPAVPVKNAQPSREQSASNGGAGGHGRDAGSAGQERAATSEKWTPQDIPKRKDANARKIAAAETMEKVCRGGLLESFRINGRPLGDITSTEAAAWAGSRERDAKFVRLLTENLPPDLPIRRFRTAEDAATLYAHAEGLRDVA